MKRLFLLLLFAMWLLPLKAHASASSIEKSFFHDPRNSLTADQLNERDFKAFDGDLNLGYKAGAVWVRIQITPGLAAAIEDKGADAALILRVGPHQLEQLELFEPAADGWVIHRAGSRWPRKAGPCIDDLHCFVLQPQTRTLYLKVVTPTLLIASFTVSSPQDITRQVAIRTGKTISTYSLSVIMLAIGVLFYLFDRSPILLAYVFLQLMILLSLIGTTGSLAQWAQWISPDSWTDLSHFFVIGRTLGTALLSRAALANYGPSKGYSAGFWLLIAALLFALAALISGDITLALQINLAITLLGPGFQIYGIFSARCIPPRVLKILLTGYACYALTVVLAAAHIFLSSISFPSAQFLPNLSDGTYSGIMVGIVVFWLVLAENARLRLLRMEEAQTLRLQVAGARAHEAALKERGALIDMLAHELKNPLGTMKFALASLTGQTPSADRVRHMEQSIHRMDQMIEMVTLSNRIEQHPTAQSREEIDAEDFVNLLAEGFPDPERFEIRIAPGTRLHVDRQLLTIAIENLMSNAFKYSVPHPIHIDVVHEAREGHARVRFEIRNQVEAGCEPDPARLFERYYRHAGLSDRPGMGIGLSLVRAAAEKMGGEVRYRLTGGWACFEVTLPC